MHYVLLAAAILAAKGGSLLLHSGTDNLFPELAKIFGEKETESVRKALNTEYLISKAEAKVNNLVLKFKKT